MAGTKDITLDQNINLPEDATADEGFVNHPHIDDTMNDSASSSASGSWAGAAGRVLSPARMSAMWTRGVDMAKPIASGVHTQVNSYPWVGVGVAAGLFLGIGYLLGRRAATSTSLASDVNDFYSPNYAPNFSSRSSADFYGSTEAGMSNTVGSRTESSARNQDLTSQDY